MSSRRRLIINGQVQGVGFRPFVYHLASRLQLSGWVANNPQGILIEIQGPATTIEHFCQCLISEQPPLAIIDQMDSLECPAQPETGFRIVQSLPPQDRHQHPNPNSHPRQAAGTGIAPDAALCNDCLDELFDAFNRRFRYPFINCTACGPRFTIVERLPYDRPNTTMRTFALCEACAEEYASADSRRFHAQPIACWHCGPRLSWRDARGNAEHLAEPLIDPVLAAVKQIQGGGIVAIKGIGGFHLVCDARNATAVSRLRQRKNRPHKPFAVMAANTRSLGEIVECGQEQEALLRSAVAPIVLLPKTHRCDQILAGVAPGLASLGVMLPYTALHYLLFDLFESDLLEQTLLVMTSANLSGEPLIIDNDAAFNHLQGIADGYLVHDRAIHVRCDDSVITGVRKPTAIMRRGRGLAPLAVKLSIPGISVLATGAQLKNTICLAQGQQAWISQHIGDLHSAATCRFFDQTVSHLQQLYAITPPAVARDLHNDYYSSRFADNLAAETGCKLVKVQHHHAHIAAVMAEHQLNGPVIGLALDGLGLGIDGTLWGGELLRAEGAGFQRLGHFQPLPLPGGDRAVREPWRMAAGALHALGRADEIRTRFSNMPGIEVLHQMLDIGFNVPMTSSAGRLFDAAAGMLGLQPVSSYEGQAAMQLESLLHGASVTPGQMGNLFNYYLIRADGTLDFHPLLGRLADEPDQVKGAMLFHATLVAGLEAWLDRAVAMTGVTRIALAGGCFANRYLLEQLHERLSSRGLAVFIPQRLPCNDGGLSLGQAWVARQLTGSG